jgi:sterol 14-demethylase
VERETERTLPPALGGAWPLLGHLRGFRRAPIELMRRVHEQCGELGEFRLGGQHIALLCGEEAHEAFFRAPDEQLDQAEAYPFMKPVFGAGVVFDAENPEQRRQAMKNQALRDQQMRGHAEVIAAETEKICDGLGAEGEIDLLAFFSELTIYTSSACLIGKEFRDEITADFASLFHELERGTDTLAYISPHLPIAAFRRRDAARKELVRRIEAIIESRRREGRRPKDLVFALTRVADDQGRPRYTADQITGMFISLMFAGHHTTSGTAAWTLIELLRHPEILSDTVSELDRIFRDGATVSYHALREIPVLEGAITEALRLHPPLVLLMRRVREEFHFRDFRVPVGWNVAVSPAVSNRLAAYFPDPERFDITRYTGAEGQHRRVFAYLSFGAGRHRCVGAAFAQMQLKAIFSVLLRRYEFELAQPSATYRNDESRMVVQLEQPCRVRYRRRLASSPSAALPAPTVGAAVPGAGLRIRVDADLCQGHGVCASECPELFSVDPNEVKVVLAREDVPPELREKAERAVRFCPTRALSLIKDDGPVGGGNGEAP